MSWNSCVTCTDHKLQDVKHMCVEGCPMGSLLSTNGKCYLPGDLYLTTTEDKCKTYRCDETGTEKCEIIEENPKCICKTNYYGLLCDTETTYKKTYVKSTIEKLFPHFIKEGKEINYNDLNFRFKVKDLATIIGKSPEIEISNIQHLLITTVTETIVDEFVKNNEEKTILLPNENLLDLIGLAVHSKVVKNDTDKLSDLVDKASKINFINAGIDPDFSTENPISYP